MLRIKTTTLNISVMAAKKTHTIKKYCGQKTLIVLDINADILSLYRESIKLRVPFAIKKEIGIQIWGAFVVADYLGIKDVTKLLN